MSALFAARACARGAGVGARRMHTAPLRLAATPPAKKDVGSRKMATISLGESSGQGTDFSALFEDMFRDMYSATHLISQKHPLKFFLSMVTFGVVSLRLYDARYGAHRYAVDMSAAGAAGAADDDDDDE